MHRNTTQILILTTFSLGLTIIVSMHRNTMQILILMTFSLGLTIIVSIELRYDNQDLF